MANLDFRRYQNETTYNTQKSAGQIPDGALFIIGDTEKIGHRYGDKYFLVGIKELESEIATLRSEFEGQNTKLESRVRGN